MHIAVQPIIPLTSESFAYFISFPKYRRIRSEPSPDTVGNSPRMSVLAQALGARDRNCVSDISDGLSKCVSDGPRCATHTHTNTTHSPTIPYALACAHMLTHLIRPVSVAIAAAAVPAIFESSCTTAVAHRQVENCYTIALLQISWSASDGSDGSG